MGVLIGTSGWQYETWRHRFFEGVAQRRWFEHTMTAFRTVELNVTFYRLPPVSTFDGWCRRSPDDAVLAVKASRYLTHIRRLREPDEPVRRLLSRAQALGPKLGPILLQLPPDLGVDIDALTATLAAFGPHRVAVEPRHESWWTDDVRHALAQYGAATVWADRNGQPVGPRWRSADWGYVRFHHGDADPAPNYSRRALEQWATWLADTFDDSDDVYVYFNNDPRCAAVDNAITFADAVADCGLTPTRVPSQRPGSWS